MEFLITKYFTKLRSNQVELVFWLADVSCGHIINSRDDFISGTRAEAENKKETQVSFGRSEKTVCQK